MKKCPQCKGEKKITVTSYENGQKSSFKMKCPTCNGVGEVTPKQEELHKKIQNAWCRCGNEQPEPYDDRPEGGHGWICSNCGGLIQTG